MQKIVCGSLGSPKVAAEVEVTSAQDFNEYVQDKESSQGWFGLEGSLKVISFQPPLPALSDCYCSHQKITWCCHRVTIVLWGNTFNASKVRSSYSTPTSEPLQIFINSVELEKRTSNAWNKRAGVTGPDREDSFTLLSVFPWYTEILLAEENTWKHHQLSLTHGSCLCQRALAG